MPPICRPPVTRRALLKSAGAAALVAAFTPLGRAVSAAGAAFTIKAVPGRVPLFGPSRAATDVWCYNAQVPGPEIRVRQGDRLRVIVENGLNEETTVHWHGIRLPNAMDGVPQLTQKPIAPGATFVYEFDVPDAGTFWYHPHQRSAEQVGRGLSGVLIVEEAESVAVDRDVTWILNDWRLTEDGRISDDFGNFMDMSHDGRVGNTVTVNGRVADAFQVRAGERLRLRLINAANARIFGLVFEGHRPWVIAYDGQPVEPHWPDGDRVVLGPAMRADLLIDMIGEPGQSFAVTDAFYRGGAYRLTSLTCAREGSLRKLPPAAPIHLPDNPLHEPDLSTAERHEVVLAGGMMGGMMGTATGAHRPNLRDLMRTGLAWTINGVAAADHTHAPALTLRQGRSYVLSLVNDTAWFHPIHLHGHSFRVIARNGTATRFREWRDTVLLAPRERAEIAFVADNPGDWMLHCHVLEHQAGGMMTTVRVA